MVIFSVCVCEVVDELESIMSRGGNIVDFHCADFFPERWFQLVVLLQCNNDVLYDRLTARYTLPAPCAVCMSGRRVVSTLSLALPPFPLPLL